MTGPAAIVVLAADGWRVAERAAGAGITYRLAPGKPYRSEAAALGDAGLVLARAAAEEARG